MKFAVILRNKVKRSFWQRICSVLRNKIITFKINSGFPLFWPISHSDMTVILHLKSWQAWQHQLLSNNTKLVRGSQPNALINYLFEYM